MPKVFWMVAALVMLAGCSVRVNKDNSGEEKDVQLRMPFGHVDVHKDAANLAAIGLSVYPDAVMDPAKGKDGKAVDVNVGFGAWKVRVQAAEYAIPDSQEKVETFYRHALAQYGAVLTCKGSVPVGEPTRTGAGLTCSDDKGGPGESSSSNSDLELKAGSRTRQHIVAFHGEKRPDTHFALLALELPREGEDAKGEE